MLFRIIYCIGSKKKIPVLKELAMKIFKKYTLILYFVYSENHLNNLTHLGDQVKQQTIKQNESTLTQNC